MSNNKFGLLQHALREKLSEAENSAADSPTPQPEPSAPTSGRSRARGKRSNPDYEQVGCYLPKTLYRDVKRKLIDDPDRDFSDLIASLLEEWLAE